MLNAKTETRLQNERAMNTGILKKMWKDQFLYLLLLPGLAFFLIYKIVPLLGSVMAFQDFSPFHGFFHSEWVGLKHFRHMFDDKEVLRVIWNTLKIALVQIVFVFPVPIVLALLLNELRSPAYKRIVQSLIYLPHFLSWVVVISVVTIFLRGDGLVNLFFTKVLGWNEVPFLTDPHWFIPLVAGEVTWKEAGWGTIIFLAALAGVNLELYESAVVDGASRWRQMWHITLPAIRSTIIILLILRLGNVMDTGFEQIFLMLNPFNKEVGDVLDTYVYFKGVKQADFSFASAVGLFKGLIGFILVVLSNRLAKRFGEEGLY